MAWPTPCQEHCRKRLQEALLSRFSSDRTQGITGGPPTATPVVGRQHQAEPAEARILFVFRIQTAPKGSQTEPTEARILFVFRIQKAPTRRQTEPAKARILFVLCNQKAPTRRQTEPAEARILFVLRIQKTPARRQTKPANARILFVFGIQGATERRQTKQTNEAHRNPPAYGFRSNCRSPPEHIFSALPIWRRVLADDGLEVNQR